MFKTSALLTTVLLVFALVRPAPAQQQTLAEAAAAAKAKRDAPTQPTKVLTNKDLVDVPEPTNVPTAVSVPPADATEPVVVETGALAKNRSAAVALLGSRLVALHEGLVARDRTAAECRDACAGK